jgi:hypothetical protein
MKVVYHCGFDFNLRNGLVMFSMFLCACWDWVGKDILGIASKSTETNFKN